LFREPSRRDQASLQDACHTVQVSKNESGRTARGHFPKGVSGNPAGRKPRTDAAPAEQKPSITDPRFDVGDLLGSPRTLAPKAQILPGRTARQRMDDWRNNQTGMGTAGRDKRMATFFSPIALSFDQLRDLALGDDLAYKAVTLLPKEAKRPGYDVTVADAGENDAEEHDLGQDAKDKLEALGADTACQRAGEHARTFGGGVVMMGVNDGQDDLTKPLNLETIKSLDWLTVLEARECLPVYAYGNPQAAKYGDPEIYRLTSRNVLPTRNGQYGAGTFDIHESRLLIFDGLRVSRYQSTAARGGWGESIFVQIWRVLRDFNTAFSAAGVLVTDFGQTVIKMARLWASLDTDEGKAFEDRLAAMDYSRSTNNAIVIDAEDSFERTQTPVNGLSDLLEKFQVRLAAACGMPLTLLFGTSPAGMNATGESDIRFFYDRVDEYRQTTLAPALRRLLQVVFRTIGNKKEPEKWSLKFKPLWQESAKEQAAAMLTQSQADLNWVNMQAITPEEVTSSHWGQGEYSPHLTIDHTGRDEHAADMESAATPEDMAAMGRDPTAPAAAAPPNGAQLSSMMEIVKAAVSGEIPRESAQALLQVAIPTLSPAQATALLGPAGFKPVVPEPPPGRGGPPMTAKPEPPAEAPRADGDDKLARTKKDLLRRLSPSGTCAACKQTGGKLEVDHVNGRNWSPRELSKTQRAARYWDEYDRGVKLRALCRSCNGSDGAKNKQKHDSADAQDPDQPRAPLADEHAE
jgi:uncharacterized protein